MLIPTISRKYSRTGYRCIQGRAILPLGHSQCWTVIRGYADASQPNGSAGKSDNGAQSHQVIQEQNDVRDDEKEEGALTRRLREMSYEALETGGSSARKAV